MTARLLVPVPEPLDPLYQLTAADLAYKLSPAARGLLGAMHEGTKLYRTIGGRYWLGAATEIRTAAVRALIRGRLIEPLPSLGRGWSTFYQLTAKGTARAKEILS